MTSHQFDQYILYHEHNPDSNVVVTVHCFLEGKTIGYIRFYDSDVPAPHILPGGAIEISFHASRVNEIIQTLRYEKPLFLSAENKKSMISTVREPVGEQEADLE